MVSDVSGKCRPSICCSLGGYLMLEVFKVWGLRTIDGRQSCWNNVPTCISMRWELRHMGARRGVEQRVCKVH